MSKNKYNRIEDFLQDQSFVNWVNQTRKEDMDFWEEWLSANPDKKALITDAAAIVKGLRFKPLEMEREKVEAALAKLNAKVDDRLAKRMKPRLLNISPLAFLAVAASVSLLIVGYLVVMSYVKPQQIVYQTVFGEQLDLGLDDGTQAVLNANSTLRYFSGKPREVWLEGEAFFEVEKKNGAAKFVVHTPDLDVEVLGTAFNVNSQDEKTEVVLERGKVKLNLKNGREEVMEPGELISFSARANKLLKKEDKVRSELHTSWKDGTLIFKEISLGEAMQKIEATYGLEVVFTDKSMEQKIISVAVPTENLDICLKALQKSMGIKINKVDNQLIVN